MEEKIFFVYFDDTIKETLILHKVFSMIHILTTPTSPTKNIAIQIINLAGAFKQVLDKSKM